MASEPVGYPLAPMSRFTPLAFAAWVQSSEGFVR
jgi:hypothetical protein